MSLHVVAAALLAVSAPAFADVCVSAQDPAGLERDRRLTVDDRGHVVDIDGRTRLTWTGDRLDGIAFVTTKGEVTQSFAFGYGKHGELLAIDRADKGKVRRVSTWTYEGTFGKPRVALPSLYAQLLYTSAISGGIPPSFLPETMVLPPRFTGKLSFTFGIKREDSTMRCSFGQDGLPARCEGIAYEHDGQGRLTKLERDVADSVSGNTEVFTYDGDRLVRAAASGFIREYSYDDQHRLIRFAQSVDGKPNLARVYRYGCKP